MNTSTIIFSIISLVCMISMIILYIHIHNIQNKIDTHIINDLTELPQEITLDKLKVKDLEVDNYLQTPVIDVNKIKSKSFLEIDTPTYINNNIHLQQGRSLYAPIIQVSDNIYAKKIRSDEGHYNDLYVYNTFMNPEQNLENKRYYLENKQIDQDKNPDEEQDEEQDESQTEKENEETTNNVEEFKNVPLFNYLYI